MLNTQNHFYKDVFLTQTDTTIGFVSLNAQRLTAVKKRPPHKHYIKAVNSLHTLKHFARVPQIHKKRVRRAHTTTFILPNTYSYRVIRETHHLLLLNRLKWAYTTSANLSGENYNEHFAYAAADTVVTPLKPHQKASDIIKLGKCSHKRIR